MKLPPEFGLTAENDFEVAPGAPMLVVGALEEAQKKIG
jgi:hypothetical protein